MNNQQPSSAAYHEATFSDRPKQEVATKTIADLLDDANALADWSSSIEKIRQKDCEAEVKHSP